MHTCPVCTSDETLPLHEQLSMPIMMNQVHTSAAAARQAKQGIVHMHGCTNCGFVWNVAYDEKLVTYDESYENDQCFSPAFSAHVLDRARDIVASIPEADKLDFLDVGCGQGSFIALVAQAAGDRLASAEGFDPAWRGQDGAGPAGSHIHKCYFSVDSAHLCSKAPNVVASRHTIEHVPDPIGFLRAIKLAIGTFGDATSSRVFIETPSVEWIIRHLAIQDFFYEHCSLFSARALALAFTRVGFHDPRVDAVFGGQHLWAQATTLQKASAPSPEESSVDRFDFTPLIEARSRFIAEWRTKVSAAAATGRVALWGAGAKGTTFALLADPEQIAIDRVIDINPGKQNAYLSSSGLPVLSPEAAAQDQPQTIFVMNPLYLDEITDTCRALNMTARLVPIN